MHFTVLVRNTSLGYVWQNMSNFVSCFAFHCVEQICAVHSAFRKRVRVLPQFMLGYLYIQYATKRGEIRTKVTRM